MISNQCHQTFTETFTVAQLAMLQRLRATFSLRTCRQMRPKRILQQPSCSNLQMQAMLWGSGLWCTMVLWLGTWGSTEHSGKANE